MAENSYPEAWRMKRDSKPLVARRFKYPGPHSIPAEFQS